MINAQKHPFLQSCLLFEVILYYRKWWLVSHRPKDVRHWPPKIPARTSPRKRPTSLENHLRTRSNEMNKKERHNAWSWKGKVLTMSENRKVIVRYVAYYAAYILILRYRNTLVYIHVCMSFLG